MTDSTLESLAERVTSLERQNRRLKAVAIAVVAVLAAAVCMGQVGVPKVVEAEKFVLRDADGRERATLGLSKEDGAALVLCAEDGACRAKLMVRPNSIPVLRLEEVDPLSRQQANVSLTGSSLSFRGADALGPRVSLDYSPVSNMFEGSGLTISDGAAKDRVSIRADSDSTSLALSDGEGRIRVLLGGNDMLGTTSLVLSDSHGQERVSLGTYEKGVAAGTKLFLSDAAGRLLFSAP